MQLLDVAIAVLVAAGLGAAYTAVDGERRRRAARRLAARPARADAHGVASVAVAPALDADVDAEVDAAALVEGEGVDVSMGHHLFLSPARSPGPRSRPGDSGAGTDPAVPR